jgi:hypothetical protein
VLDDKSNKEKDMSIEAMKLALEAHKKNERHQTVAETRYWCQQYKLMAEQFIQAIEQAEQPACEHEWLRGECLKCGQSIEQAEQAQPFGYFRYDLRLDAWVQNRAGITGTPFYTAPPQRQPLTDEEIFSIWRKHTDLDAVRYTPYEDDGLAFARAIEAKLKEKNNV